MPPTGKPPRLREIAEQFNLRIEGEVDVILRIVEYDRRVPRFFERDPESGEIASVDLERIKADPRFNKVVERSIAGWEGKKAPSIHHAAAGRGRAQPRVQTRNPPGLLLVYPLPPLRQDHSSTWSRCKSSSDRKTLPSSV